MGFFGKLPSRGDFVRFGLSRDLIGRWDRWLQSVLPVDGIPATLAPWRFAFAAGVCGPDRATGAWLPSRDRIGRSFPLLVAAEGDADPAVFPAAAEALGRAAIAQRLSPQTVAARLAADPSPSPSMAAVAPGGLVRWWRGDAASDVLVGDDLPDADGFAAMLVP